MLHLAMSLPLRYNIIYSINNMKFFKKGRVYSNECKLSALQPNKKSRRNT